MGVARPGRQVLGGTLAAVTAVALLVPSARGQAAPPRDELDVTTYEVVYQVPGMSRVSVQADVPFKDVPGGALRLDVYRPPDVGRDPRVQAWVEAVRLVVAQIGGEVYVRGNCDQAPFSLASMMRGAADWMMDLMDEDNRERAGRLLDHCAEAGLQFVRLMAKTGAHMVSSGDSPAGPDLVSPGIYREFALPWEKRLADEAHDLGLPYALHICGRTDRILDEMVGTGADALDLDYKTDACLAHDRMKDRATFIGNLDPSGVLALGTPPLVEEKTRELLAVFADTPRFVLNAGCAIPATTPGENLRAMIRAARG